MKGPHASRAEPVYFGQPPCFGWFHGRHAKGLPVLVCGPVGVEDLTAHALLRFAAEALAEGGQPCLRFDLAGQGDSSPLDADDNAVSAWLASVHAAAGVLRELTGAPRIALLGLRLGASLAALAASTRNDIEAFCAWAPITSGRSMLREWKLLGSTDVPNVSHADGSLESGGFRYSAATCAGLRALSLTTPTVRPAPRMLVIDRDDFPGADLWCTALADSGVAVETERLPGFTGLLAKPHLALLPELWLRRGVAWLQGVQGAEAASAVAGDGAGWARASLTSPRPSGEMRLQFGGGVLHERPVFLVASSSSEPTLLAMQCEPWGVDGVPIQGRTAVLVLNTGAERRIGPHGQFVALARRWAAAGALTLRLDLAGLGDSDRTASPEQRPQDYPALAMADIGRALAYLRSQPGVTRVAVLGLCSGAFHAFEAAALGLPLDLAVAINPLVFFRPTPESFDKRAAQDHAVQHLSGEALRNLFDPARWRKMLRGQVHLAFILSTLGRRLLLAGRRRVRSTARAVGRPWPDDVAAKLQRAAGPQATTRLCFVFSERDAGLALLLGEAGPAMRALQRHGRVAVEIVPGADHTFGRAEWQQQLAEVLDRVLGLPQPPRQAGHLASPGDPADQTTEAETRASSMRRARCASASSI